MKMKYLITRCFQYWIIWRILFKEPCQKIVIELSVVTATSFTFLFHFVLLSSIILNWISLHSIMQWQKKIHLPTYRPTLSFTSVQARCCTISMAEKADERENVTWVAVRIGQSVSAELSSMVGWMEELLLGGQEVGWMVQAVQRVEEVHL